MKQPLVLLFLIVAQAAFGQNIGKVLVQSTDPFSLYLNDGDSTNLYYYQILPEGKPTGVLIILPSGGETTEALLGQIDLHRAAADEGLFVIVPSINWGTENRLAEISFLDTIFKNVVKQHQVPKDKFIFCGLSNGGMISFKYAISAVKDSSTFIIPRGIIGLDPPLDFARFYAYCEREIARNASAVGVAEANYMRNVYNDTYGGSPDDFPQQYVEASTFSYGVKDGGNAKYLNDISIRMHSDLNIDYLLNQRKRDLYDWNGADIVAFVNQLKINGNQDAEVIITQNKGVRADGTIHPHSWSIMDTVDTLEWILKVLE